MARNLHGSRSEMHGALKRAAPLRAHLHEVPGLVVDDESMLESAGVAEWDPLKLCVEVSALRLTGYQAKEWLNSEHHLVGQLGDTRRLVFSLTYSDDDLAIGRLCEAVDHLATEPPNRIGRRLGSHRWRS